MHTSQKIVWHTAAVAAAALFSASVAHAHHWNDNRHAPDFGRGYGPRGDEPPRAWRAQAYRQFDRRDRAATLDRYSLAYRDFEPGYRVRTDRFSFPM